MKKITLFLVLLGMQLLLFEASAAEQLFYSTNFQNWTALSSSTTSTVNNFSTNYGDAFTATMTSVSVLPANVTPTTGSIASNGAVRFEKVATASFILSQFSSITKIVITGYVTAPSRGFSLYTKTKSDADWVLNTTSILTTTGGQSFTLPINKDSVQIKIVNNPNTQYFFLTDLAIYGNTDKVVPVFKSSTPATGSVIPTSGTIKLNYSEKVTRGTGSIVLGTDTIKDSAISYSDSTVTINYSGLSTDKAYNLTIPAGAFVDSLAVPTASAVSLAFTTPDTQAPTLSFQTDANGSTVPVTGTIALLYSEAVKAGSSKVTIGSTSITPAISASQSTLVYLNYSGLDYATTYTVTIPAGAITDASGNAAAAQTFTITTEGNYKGTSLFSITPTSTTFPSSLTGDVTKTITGTDTTKTYSVKFGNVTSPIDRSSNGWGFKVDYVLLPKTPIGQVSFKIQCGGGTAPQKYYIQKLGVDGVTWSNIDTIMIGTNDVVTFTSAVAESSDSTTIRLYKDGTNFWFYNATVYNFLDNNAANDDGKNPSVASSTPANGAIDVATTGTAKIIFSESVKSGSASFILNGKVLTPNALGSTVTLPYSNLKYSTQYQLIVQAGAVKDNLGNPCGTDTITFTTKAKPAVTPALYDFVVAKDGSGNGTTIQSAFDAVPASNTAVFRIFVKNGTYSEYPSLADGKTNVSLIGQDRDKVIITGNHYSGLVSGGITYGTSTSQTLEIFGDNFYCENITVKNTAGRDIGQAVALKVYADKAVFKNVRLLGYQDTHMTGNVATDRQYYLNSDIHGTVDFMFNDGIAYYDNCSLYIEDRATANVVCAPATTTANTYGYVYNGCTIDGASSQDGVYYLARPWKNSPRAVYINTKMNINPATDLWTTMSSLPALFAEYNSVSKNGSVLTFAPRTDFTFTSNSVTTTDTLKTTRKSTITATEAANYTVANVLAGSDSWDATTKIAAPAAVENLAYDSVNAKLSWTAVDGAACYVVLLNDSVVKFTTSTTFDTLATASSLKVIAVSEYGALSSATTAITTGITNAKIKTGFLVSTLIDKDLKLINPENFKTVELVSVLGQKVLTVAASSSINVSSLNNGVYLAKGYAKNGDVYIDKIVKK